MRLLGRNLSLVAGDFHLATSLSSGLEVAKQLSSVLQGESPTPSLLHRLGFRQLRSGLLLLQTMVLQTMFLQTMCRRCFCMQMMFLQTMFQDVPADDVTLPNRLPGT